MTQLIWSHIFILFDLDLVRHP